MQSTLISRKGILRGETLNDYYITLIKELL